MYTEKRVRYPLKADKKSTLIFKSQVTFPAALLKMFTKEYTIYKKSQYVQFLVWKCSILVICWDALNRTKLRTDYYVKNKAKKVYKNGYLYLTSVVVEDLI